MNRKKQRAAAPEKKSLVTPPSQQQRLLALKNKHLVPSVPFAGQRIPALLVNVESSNVVKLIICLGDSGEMTVMMSLYRAHVPLSHSFCLSECKAAAAVEEYLTTTLHMFELVEVMFVCCDDRGRFCGSLYLSQDESINEALVKDGLASEVKRDWTAQDFERMVRSRGGSM